MSYCGRDRDYSMAKEVEAGECSLMVSLSKLNALANRARAICGKGVPVSRERLYSSVLRGRMLPHVHCSSLL